MRVLVFNKGVLRRELDFTPRRSQREKGDYIYIAPPQTTVFHSHGWFREDFTTALLNDVPIVYRTLLLLLT